MKNKTIKILTYIMIFIIYYTFPQILNLIIEVFNIDIKSLSRFYILIFIYSIEILPLLFLILIYKKDLKTEFEIYKSTLKNNIDTYVRLWLFALILMTFSNSIINIITKIPISNNESAVRNMANLLPIYSLFTTCICAPLGEELAYRKTIGNIFTNKKIAIVISGLIFGIAHVIGTYTSLVDLVYIIPYGLFGSVFMYIYLNSKTIWSTISIHFIHNTLLIILYFLR